MDGQRLRIVVEVLDDDLIVVKLAGRPHGKQLVLQNLEKAKHCGLFVRLLSGMEGLSL